jgi:UDP-N-acetyl-D-glucosamine dehydrogenase
MPRFCADRVNRALNGHAKPVRGSRVAILGVSYKSGVGDLRESPALKLMHLLAEQGADLVYHDDYIPELPELGLSSTSLSDTLAGCDVAVIVTAHPGLDLDEVLSAPLVVDFRGVTSKLSAANLIRL